MGWSHLLSVALVGALAGCSSHEPMMDAPQRGLVTAMRRVGVRDIHLRDREDAGLLINARLAHRSFSMAVPSHWNHEVLLFAHGYTTPGTALTVPSDPVKDDVSLGMLTRAYGEGYAVGLSSFDKAGLGVESATINTLRLRDALAQSGAKRIYVAGGSMGGNIVMSLIERYPHAFAGAIAACGVTDGWEPQFEHMMDMRAVYNAMTKGTRYALPGDRDVTADALSPATGWSGLPGDLFRLVQLKRLASPIFKLFAAAKANPNGSEAHIIDVVADVSGYQPEIASFVFPLTTVALGMSDMTSTWGGLVYGNRVKVYHSHHLARADVASLNVNVQRFDADPQAIVKARQWHRSTGQATTPLIAFHNRIDALVPFSQAEGLRRRLTATGNTRAIQYVAPAVIRPLPFGGVSGYTHCGFSPRQTGGAWDAMRQWIETGQRPGKALP